jgi:hypothetical protein
MSERNLGKVEEAFTYYKARQGEIIAGHINEYVVIKGRQVLGYYVTLEAAFESMAQAGEELETFIVQRCQEPGTDIANYYNNAVAFA